MRSIVLMGKFGFLNDDEKPLSLTSSFTHVVEFFCLCSTHMAARSTRKQFKMID